MTRGVVIEAVSPEIDGGRSAIKRVVGDQVHVEADIFTDGHDVINAAVLSRLAGETEWRRDPMLFVDNDRWHGHFPLTRNARYEYTVEAWRDDFSSWLRGLDADGLRHGVGHGPMHQRADEAPSPVHG